MNSIKDEVSAENIARLYANRFPMAARQRKERIWQVLCRDFFQRYVKETDTLLEIASGFGEFIRNIHAERKIALDVSMEARAFLTDDIEFHQVSAQRMPFLADNEIDVCFSSNFFEHLPSKDAMLEVLNEARRVLKPGALYVAMQPNIRYAPGEYWDYWDHHIPLTHRSAAEAFRLAGFHIVELYDRFLPFSTDGRLPQHPLLVKLYLKVPFMWQLLGRQFLLVARKT
jgi:ubiquinone/menaquinone biosynthesis C-methylase UbiE